MVTSSSVDKLYSSIQSQVPGFLILAGIRSHETSPKFVSFFFSTGTDVSDSVNTLCVHVREPYNKNNSSMRFRFVGFELFLLWVVNVTC